jgi:hypothetical protein
LSQNDILKTVYLSFPSVFLVGFFNSCQFSAEKKFFMLMFGVIRGRNRRPVFALTEDRTDGASGLVFFVAGDRRIGKLIGKYIN